MTMILIQYSTFSMSSSSSSFFLFFLFFVPSQRVKNGHFQWESRRSEGYESLNVVTSKRRKLYKFVSGNWIQKIRATRTICFLREESSRRPRSLKPSALHPSPSSPRARKRKRRLRETIEGEQKRWGCRSTPFFFLRLLLG